MSAWNASTRPHRSALSDGRRSLPNCCPHRWDSPPRTGYHFAGHPLARGVTVARLTLDQLVLVRIQAGQRLVALGHCGGKPPPDNSVKRGDGVLRCAFLFSTVSFWAGLDGMSEPPFTLKFTMRATKNPPRWHHFVPQFHLRQFMDSSGRLAMLDRGTGLIH